MALKIIIGHSSTYPWNGCLNCLAQSKPPNAWLDLTRKSRPAFTDLSLGEIPAKSESDEAFTDPDSYRY